MQSWPAPELPVLPSAEPTPLLVPDSTSRSLVALPGESGDEVRIYVCGITPYDSTHLGHAATYLLFDTLIRTCIDAGRPVRFVQNITDVDDPLLERAAATGEDWQQLAQRETQRFREDMAALRVVPPEAYIGVVEAIPDIVAAVQQLQANDDAYDLDGDIYFSVKSGRHFGEVCNLEEPEMLRLSAERGGDPDRPGKADPLDPLLWRAERPGDPSWQSDVGAGRPGWHIECSAIALKYLGEQIHVQGGGEDLLFPHHEFSAQHAVGITGKWPFAATNVHQALIAYDGEKMSKSRGNLVFVSKLRADGVDPMAIRLALLKHSSREPWEWHDHELTTATEQLRRWREAAARQTAASAAALLSQIRSSLRNGIDAPSAVAAVDQWCEQTGDDPAAPSDAAAAIDALLGIALNPV